MTKSTHPRRSAAGFSLTELVVTLTVAGILAAIAVPSFRGMIVRSKLTTQANELLVAVNIARSEAIKGNRNVLLCRATSATATDCASGTGNWTDWIVCRQTPSANTCASVLRRGSVDTSAGITVTTTLSGDAARFRADGLGRTGASGETMLSNQRFTITSSRISADNTRCLRLGAASTARVETVTGACT